jgi:hypothetical protein
LTRARTTVDNIHYWVIGIIDIIKFGEKPVKKKKKKMKINTVLTGKNFKTIN